MTGGHLDAGAGGGLAGEVVGVDGVDGGEVVDVSQEDGGLHHVAAIHAGGSQNLFQVVQGLGGLGLHALRQLAGGRN